MATLSEDVTDLLVAFGTCFRADEVCRHEAGAVLSSGTRGTGITALSGGAGRTLRTFCPGWSLFPFLTGAGQIGEGADWAFEEALPGDVSPVFENSQAFYTLELLSSDPGGILPLEEASVAIEATLLFDRKLERAVADAQQVALRAQAGEPLPNVAAELGLEIRSAGPFSRTDFVPGIGRQNAAVGAAFALSPGAVSDAVATPANVFVIEVLSRTEADEGAWLDQKTLQRQAAIGVLQQQRLAEWIEALRAAATIVDRRDEVLQPADEDAVQIPPIF